MDDVQHAAQDERRGSAPLILYTDTLVTDGHAAIRNQDGRAKGVRGGGGGKPADLRWAV